MKKCPFCAEEIQDEAIKCRHCNEFLDGRISPKPERPWYFRDGTVIAAVLCLLVLALPLVWWNPFYTRTRKIVVSVIVLALTWITWMTLAQALKEMQAYYQMIM